MMLLQGNAGNANQTCSNQQTLERNLQSMLARSDNAEIAVEMNKLLQAIDERPEPQKRSSK